MLRRIVLSPFPCSPFFQALAMACPMMLVCGLLGPAGIGLAADLSPASPSIASEVMEFSIPAQALGEALTAFAAQSNVQLLVPSELTGGKRSAELSGRFPPMEALTKLLDGTGLTYEITDAGTITLRQTLRPFRPVTPKREPPSSSLPAGSAVSANSKPIHVPEIIVKDVRETDYNPERATTATKTDTPIQLTPATVNVVTRQVLQDRQPRNFTEALRTVPGINATSPRISTQNMLSRGFSLRQAGGEFRNGLRHLEDTNLAPEIANVQRFEILKGPSSVLYGLNGLGGALNVITKVPRSERSLLLEQSIGHWNYYRTAADAGGRIDEEGTWSWRFNGSFEDTKHFQDFVDQRLVLLNPSLAWRPSSKTSLVLDFEFLRADFKGNVHGLPADGTVLDSPIGRMPIRRSIFDPNFNRQVREQYYIGYQFDHRFNEHISLHQGFLWARNDQPVFEESNMFGFVGGLTGDRRFVQRQISRFEGGWDSFALDTNVLGKFATGPVRHEFLAGVDLYRSIQNFDNFFVGSLPDLDLLNPVYRVQPTGPLTNVFAGRFVQEWVGVYLQETLIPWESLRVVLAGRATFIRTENEDLLDPSFSTSSGDVPLTPRFGIVYTPIEPISLFASYSESFIPRTGRTFSGEAFDPERGVSYEGGIKGTFLDGRLSSTLAVFRMIRSNVLTTDPANPNFSIQTGEQRSQGVEWDVLGSPLPGWEVAAAFTWLDTKVTNDNALLVGQRLQGAPRFSASVWNVYTLQDGPLKGLGGGFGVFYEGKRWGQLVTPGTTDQGFYIPDYVRLDASVFYRHKRYELQVNINNLTDRRYFSGVLSRNLVYPGEPLNVIATLRIPILW